MATTQGLERFPYVTEAIYLTEVALHSLIYLLSFPLCKRSHDSISSQSGYHCHHYFDPSFINVKWHGSPKG